LLSHHSKSKITEGQEFGFKAISENSIVCRVLTSFVGIFKGHRDM